MPLERSLACGWEGGVKGIWTLTSDLPLWIKQCGQARAAAMLAVVWETFPAASLPAKWGRCSCLCLISVAASLATLTHPRMGWMGL